MPGEQGLDLSAPPISVDDSGADNEETPTSLETQGTEDSQATEVDGSDTTPNQPETYTLSRSNFAKDLADLQQSDPEVANTINAAIGRKAKLKYQPQIDELQLEIEGLRTQIATAKFANISQEDLGPALAKDPTLAGDYAVATRGANNGLEARRTQLRQQQQISGILDVGLDAGLSSERVEQFQTDISSGKYDRDANGQPLNGDQALLILQGDVLREVRGLAAPVAVSTPQRADGASPDMGEHTRPGAVQSKWTWAQINEMTPPERLSAFPGDDDFQNALRSGKISGIPDDVKGTL